MECLTNPLEPNSEFSTVYVPLICDEVRMCQGRLIGSGTFIMLIFLNLFCALHFRPKRALESGA